MRKCLWSKRDPPPRNVTVTKYKGLGRVVDRRGLGGFATAGFAVVDDRVRFWTMGMSGGVGVAAVWVCIAVFAVLPFCLIPTFWNKTISAEEKFVRTVLVALVEGGLVVILVGLLIVTMPAAPGFAS